MAGARLAPRRAGRHASDLGRRVHRRFAPWRQYGFERFRDPRAELVVRVLMLAQSPVAGDSRILREASTLAASGHEVHIIGREIPDDFVPPPGVTVSSIGMARGYGCLPGLDGDHLRCGLRVGCCCQSIAGRSNMRGSSRLATLPGRTGPSPDVVHAHDFNTLPLGPNYLDALALGSCTTRTSSGVDGRGSVVPLRCEPPESGGWRRNSGDRRRRCSPSAKGLPPHYAKTTAGRTCTSFGTHSSHASSRPALWSGQRVLSMPAGSRRFANSRSLPPQAGG